MPAASSDRPTAGALLADLTREIVRLHAVHYGKGPTAARSFWVGDTLVCQMEQVLTPAERTLVAGGKAAEAHAIRSGVREIMERPLIEVVERLTGRTVRAILGQVHLDAEVDIDVFVLVPER